MKELKINLVMVLIIIGFHSCEFNNDPTPFENEVSQLKTSQNDAEFKEKKRRANMTDLLSSLQSQFQNPFLVMSLGDL
ncbi:hypothetical protein KDU71_09510 [Carboxylicivirga sediminis]|uniref:Uncharacterized protein n=1 Tax=Carboxylicivirga sediminis TaxID=2006564 RepID=A0A941F5T9_9BACT|nr:hypothetical protein [Carboxylicivirga sediminis]MBR8535790.1 hypothetical protein [Carboxylicivirga sediminis]